MRPGRGLVKGGMNVQEKASADVQAGAQEALRRVRVARHPERPYALDYIERLFKDFVELHGDRRFADDQALICGFADFHDVPVAVVAHQKGRDTKQRRLRNFGMPKPEGYRKALRVMKLAEKFGRPVITLVDTPGAYPGIDAEERGQAEAIANNLLVMARLDVPIVVAIIGEGGSGGALAIGVGDVVQMLENAIYSVISPEGCAAILWKSGAERAKAAAAEYRAALHILTPASATWSPPVITVSGLANEGLDAVWQAVLQHRAKLSVTGELEAKRRAQDAKWMWALVDERMHVRLRADADTRARVDVLERRVTEGALSPTAAADEIAALLGL